MRDVPGEQMVRELTVLVALQPEDGDYESKNVGNLKKLRKQPPLEPPKEIKTLASLSFSSGRSNLDS